ncbi:DUF5343 domain-containing protein [Candidatus Poriferisodalis sp.]|uniref:DUF5343 domain-containing protein n=1 Tax=Candidatus Poriferisodalis sp. TaxID=3101277 RepID=UPI003B012DFC
MAEVTNKRTYPRLPAKNWWTLREKFKQSVPTTVDADYLQSVLGLTSPRAAANLLGPLRALGLIDDSGQPTRRAYTWRLDESYAQTCEDMSEEVYPDSLRSAFPHPSDNRDGVTSWFSRNTDAGQNAASGMAALFSIIASGEMETARAGESTAGKPKKKAVAKEAAPAVSSQSSTEVAAGLNEKRSRRVEPELNVNVQIHISSEASAGQIDQIFKSMAEHLYGAEQQSSE